MSHYNTIYNQLLQLVPRHEFEKIVKKHKGDHYVKYFTSWQQFIVLLYAQVRGKNSLRDIKTSLVAQENVWYHIGLEKIRRTTLADANSRRDYEIFEEIFKEILLRCRSVTPKHKFKFKNPLYSIDSTVIDLCLSIFPWTKFRQKKGGLKLHYLYDHSGYLPTFLTITDAKVHDVKVVKEINMPLIADSIISVDRAYIDFSWLYSLDKQKVYFVTRLKKGINYQVSGQQQVNQAKGILADLKIKLNNPDYPKKLRLVKYYDQETNKLLIFITNNFNLSAYTITCIYKSRWQIELFFKWIKQNLKIKSFLGTSKNAVLTQIWVAMCYYLLLCYIKYQTKYKYSLLELTRILNEVIFLRISLVDVLSLNTRSVSKARDPALVQNLLF